MRLACRDASAVAVVTRIGGGLVAALLAAAPCAGQPLPLSEELSTRQPAVERPAYALDRSEEDWSAVDGSAGGDRRDRAKRLSLGRPGSALTLAGEAWSIYDFYDGHNWGAGPQDGDGYLLLRFMGSADARLGRQARVFVELRSGLVEGRRGGPRPSQDRDELDISQLFFGWRTAPGLDGLSRLELKAGRQELHYGDGTLLAIRELNVRRTFDGVKAILRPAGWRIDLLAFRPARIETRVFDDGFEPSQSLWGVWAVKPLTGRAFWTQTDLYYLGLDRREARFQQGSAPERRHTVGVNLRGQRGALSLFSEADLQLGRFGTGRIRAWKVAQRLSWSFPSRRLRPVLKLQGAVSSGDRDPVDSDLQTFHPLFPKGVYYGRLDGSGALNALVVHPELDLAISPTVSLEISHFSFWRQSTRDGLYSPSGSLLRSGAATRDRYVGSLQELAARWLRDRHTAVELLAGYYEAGSFLRRSLPKGRDTVHLALKWHFKY